MEALWKYLLEEEAQYTKNLEAFRDVYVNMIQRETVVPQSVQDELYPGFDRLLAGQAAFFASIKDTPPPPDLLVVYRRMFEQCEQAMMQYLGNVARAVGVLLELTLGNRTWKVYMEGAVLDAKAKGRDFYTFLVMPRAHVGKLIAIMTPFEGTKPTIRALEALEVKCRNVAGKAAVEEAKNRPGVPGLSKLKLSVPDFLDRPTRRLVREGKVLAQATGLGSGASKKKAMEVGYWFCDDCFMWGAVKGPVKSCVRFLQCQMSVERLDEGGFAIDLSDAGTGHSVSIVCADDLTKTMWESDLGDWVSYAIEGDRRARRDEAERIQFEAEERARQEAERIRLMEAERAAVAQRRAEDEKRAAERARVAEIERQERLKQVAEQARSMEIQRKQEQERLRLAEIQRQDKARQEAEKMRLFEAERLERLSQESQERERLRLELERARAAELEHQRQIEAQAAIERAVTTAKQQPVPVLGAPPPSLLPPPSLASRPAAPPPLTSPGRGSGQVASAGVSLPPPPPLVAPSLDRTPTLPVMARTNSGPTPVPELVRSNSTQGLMSHSMPTVPQLPVSPGRSTAPVASAIPSAVRPAAPNVSPRTAASVAGRGIAVQSSTSVPGSPVTSKVVRSESAGRRSDPVLDGFATPLPNSMLPSSDSGGPRVPQPRAEKPPPWAATSPPPSGSSSPMGGGGGGWATANPSANAAAMAAAPVGGPSPPSTPTSSSGPRLPQQRVEKPPPWETQQSMVSPNSSTGPRLPQKRTEAPPPWEAK